MSIDINDVRTIKQFKNGTFSNYKKSDVKKELVKSIYNHKIEESCYWISEFICSGQLIDAWETILLILSKHIHLANPKLPLYINMRYQNFRDILKNGYIDNELELRNNVEIRKLFCEICCTMCLSSKKPIMQIIKPKISEFNLHMLSDELKAPNVFYIKPYFEKEDPKELFIALNEFCYQLIEVKETIPIIFWIDCILDYDKTCKKNKKQLFACRRSHIPVSEKDQLDPVWILWDIIINISKKQSICHKIIQNILELYCIRYNNNTKRKRKDLMYHCIYLLTENVDFNISIFKNKDIIEKVTSKTEIIYKEIKKNEISPNTDYLFMNQSTKSQTEKTIAKIKKMNEMLN